MHAQVNGAQPSDVLTISNASKTFPGVRALRGVTLGLRRGEVHALMGENGAGKSTLLKILSGFYQPDAGAQLRLDGEAVSFRTPKDAQLAGISTIYQELDLVPQLATYENVFIGREPRRLGAISHRAMIREASALFERMGVDVEVKRSLGEQSPAVQQLTSIARALQLEAKVVIMDEPTSSLDDLETKLLFRIVGDLRDSGTSVVFVSHRLSEVYEICDRITVLRDGELLATAEADELDEYELVQMMVGRPVDADQRARARTVTRGTPVVEADRLSTSKLRDVSIELRSGEVTGVAGLLGSGRTELARSIFGADAVENGSVRVNGSVRATWSIRRAISSGVAYTPEERRSDGIFPNMSLEDNITISSLASVSTWGVINRRKQRAVAQRYVERLRIKSPTLTYPISKLSGGNQQKAILGRWLATRPTVLLLDEPTRGIDVGAKAEVEAVIRELAEAGLAVLFISSELPELLRNSNSILVLRDGRVAAQYDAADASQETIMSAIARAHEPDQTAATGGAK